MLEIGCGTGSSTVAFSHFVKLITAYDIDENSIAAAKQRSDILNLTNIEYNLVSPETLLSSITANKVSDQVDIVLLFAVLEHMTIDERHNTINFCWDLLSENGLLVIVETPNILQYFDSHTSILPFFHMLPSTLCSKYSVKSPRQGFNDDFSEADSLTESHVKMARWGRGISYHDFELTIGSDYGKYIVANGYEQEIIEWFAINIEEEILRYYIDYKKYHIHDAFKRNVLNIIFSKNISFNNISLPVPPPTLIYDVAIKDKLLECEKKLRKQNGTIEQMLNSKRWKFGELIGLSRRQIKKVLKITS